ncbi:MAG: hypothetical protein JWN78_3229 [Bacteroidota bacterium]|nr:hypothetical protein [Bacteroidota bacterium]
MLIFLFVLFFSFIMKAQDLHEDSAFVAKSFKELAILCKKVDFADPKVQKYGVFYNAAPFILYMGNDKKRAWKDFANYLREDEKKGVDEVCLKINQTVNQDPAYKIVQYITQTESEGTWHVLTITYIKKGVEKKAAFAFLKIGNRFGLGDVD